MKITIVSVVFVIVVVLSCCCGGAQAAVDFKTADKQAIDVLQSSWYEQSTGIWRTTNWWNSANLLNALIDYSIYTNDNKTFINTIQNTYSKNTVFNKEGIDDEGWWGLAWARAYTLTRNANYLKLSEAIFKDMTDYWDNQCNGGVWWNRAKTYKNAVTNELYFALAATLYLQTNDATYLTWAKREWAWFEASGMINSNTLINDGIDNCKNNGQTTWTYNQGVVLGGLVDLWRATKNDTLIQVAKNIAFATFKHLVYADGVLREPCETSKNCNGDQCQFKGIFMRFLGYLYTATKDTTIRDFISSNANSIWNKDRHVNGNSNYLGIYWEGPYDMDDACRQSSAIEALNAALLI